MKTIESLQVGDQVWISDVNRVGLKEVIVQKVGRALITAGGKVYRKDSGRANDAYGHQTLIPDMAAHRERQERFALWTRIRNHYCLPETVTLANVKQAAKLLGVEA